MECTISEGAHFSANVRMGEIETLKGLVRGAPAFASWLGNIQVPHTPQTYLTTAFATWWPRPSNWRRSRRKIHTPVYRMRPNWEKLSTIYSYTPIPSQICPLEQRLNGRNRPRRRRWRRIRGSQTQRELRATAMSDQRCLPTLSAF